MEDLLFASLIDPMIVPLPLGASLSCVNRAANNIRSVWIVKREKNCVIYVRERVWVLENQSLQRCGDEGDWNVEHTHLSIFKLVHTF